MLKKLHKKHERIEQIYKWVGEHFNDREKSIQWFMSKNSQLMNKAPMHYIRIGKVNYLWRKVKLLLDK